MKVDQSNITVESPCIRNCCLDSCDICIGCRRHIDEILAWRHLNAADKKKVLQRCQQRQHLISKVR